jgi:peroxiredoxin
VRLDCSTVRHHKEISMLRTAAALLAAATLASFAFAAGKDDKKAGVSVGDASPVFKDLEGVDGKKHSLSDYKKDVVVICITCNHCPVAVSYEDRIIAFNKKYADKVDLVAINVNNLAEDKLDKMIIRAKEKGMTYSYLYDPSQKIARELGAAVTPHFFVLNKDRKVVYIGAMDDDQSKPTTSFLDAAVDATLKGEKVEKTSTKARGCSIKYE